MFVTHSYDSYSGDLSLANSKIKRVENELNSMRLTELKLTEEIGQHKAYISVGKSRFLYLFPIGPLSSSEPMRDDLNLR